MVDEQKIAYSEVLVILKNIEPKYQKKIPTKLIKFFEENSAPNHVLELEDNKLLYEQNLNRRTLALLAMLQLHYWCETEEEKQELLEKYIKNEQICQQEIKEKYSIDKIFRKRIEKNKKNNKSNNKKDIIEYEKKSIIDKIISKIKKIFK